MYYYAAQLQHFAGWDLTTVADSSRDLLVSPDTGYSVFFSYDPISLSQKWRSGKHRLELKGFLPKMLIWHNQFYKHLAKIDKHLVWEKVGIGYISQVLNDPVMKLYNQMILEFPFLRGYYYQYIQLYMPLGIKAGTLL